MTLQTMTYIAYSQFAVRFESCKDSVRFHSARCPPGRARHQGPRRRSYHEQIF